MILEELRFNVFPYRNGDPKRDVLGLPDPQSAP